VDPLAALVNTVGCTLFWVFVMAAAGTYVLYKVRSGGSGSGAPGIEDILNADTMDSLARDLERALGATSTIPGPESTGAGSAAADTPLESSWPTAVPVTPDDNAIGFGQLKAGDPDFDADRFYLFVAKLFGKARFAVASGDLTPMRAWADANALATLQALVDEDEKAGVSRELKDLQVTSVRALAVDRDMPFERVHVRIVATAVPRSVDRATGRLVDPDRLGDGITRRTIQEYWTLSRYAGAPHSDDRMPDTCPNCGGPLDGGDSGVCGYCGLHVDPEARGSGDWVVHAISPG
jgi:predicted lipid-binding transport protein (Tim44 family)